MSRRSSSIDAPVEKNRHRTSSWHQPSMFPSVPKRTMTSPPPGSNVYEKRQSSAEIMIQRLKQKFNKPINRQTSSPNCSALIHSGFETPGRHHQAGYAANAKKDERSRSLNAVYATTPPQHVPIDPESIEDDFDADSAWSRYSNHCGHRGHYQPAYYGQFYEQYPIADEEEVMQVQKQIYRAKSEAKTVSVVNGCLYINYQYVGPLPPGCVV